MNTTAGAGAGAQRFIILPDVGYRGRALAEGKLSVASGAVRVERKPGENIDVQVLAALDNNGPRLVEMTVAGELALRQEFGPRLQIVPLMQYQLPDPYGWPRRRDGEIEVASAAVGVGIETLVSVSDAHGHRLAGARVVAFTGYRHRIGSEAWTDDAGRAVLALAPGTHIERLYVMPPNGFWGHYRASFALEQNLAVTLRAADPADDAHPIRRLYGALPEDAGAGVTVGIIDTGIDATHPDLRVSGGRGCVFDENSVDPAASDDFADVNRHGTHVAGIVGARGRMRGVAGGVELRAYRVFPRIGNTASNFDIMMAINAAVEDGCDIVNLSLGGPHPDAAIRGAIGDAAARGVLVVAAAGNDTRRPLSYPANYEQAVAVTAIGQRSCIADDALEAAEIARPFSSLYPDIFLAAFTNVGPLVDLTAPGVGICSTVPGGEYAVLSGTSMAAPMVSGFAAHLLAEMALAPDWRDKEPTMRREDLVRQLYRSAVALDLGRQNEGFGVPLPERAGARLASVKGT